MLYTTSTLKSRTVDNRTRQQRKIDVTVTNPRNRRTKVPYPNPPHPTESLTSHSIIHIPTYQSLKETREIRKTKQTLGRTEDTKVSLNPNALSKVRVSPLSSPPPIFNLITYYFRDADHDRMWAFPFIPKAPLGSCPMTCVHMAIKYRFWGADHGAQGYWLGWVLVCVMDFFLFSFFTFFLVCFLM